MPCFYTACAVILPVAFLAYHGVRRMPVIRSLRLSATIGRVLHLSVEATADTTSEPPSHRSQHLSQP